MECKAECRNEAHPLDGLSIGQCIEKCGEPQDPCPLVVVEMLLGAALAEGPFADDGAPAIGRERARNHLGCARRIGVDQGGYGAAPPVHHGWLRCAVGFE